MKAHYYDPMFYICSKEMPFMCHISVILKQPVSEEALCSAAEKTMRRYPHFSMKIVRDGEEYLTVPNPLPVIVYQVGQTVFPLGGDEVNGHLLAFGFHDCVIDFFMSHCITDGGGFAMLLKTLLYYYLCDATGTTLDPTGVELADSPIYPDEIGNPFPEEQMKNARPFYQKKRGEFFRLRDGGYVTDHRQTAFRFRVPEKAMMTFSYDHDGSPNALLSVLMTRAIHELHPDVHKNIVCAISFNLRPAICARHNYRMLSSTLLADYPDSTRKDSVLKMCTCTRGMISLQSQPENVLHYARQRKALVESLDRLPTLEERCRVMRARALEDANSNTFSLSYIGKQDMGSIMPYIEAIYTVTDGSTYENAFLEVTSTNGMFNISLLQGFSSDVYYRALLRQFAECGIPFTEDGIVSFEIPDIVLPK